MFYEIITHISITRISPQMVMVYSTTMAFIVFYFIFPTAQQNSQFPEAITIVYFT